MSRPLSVMLYVYPGRLGEITSLTTVTNVYLVCFGYLQQCTLSCIAFGVSQMRGG